MRKSFCVGSAIFILFLSSLAIAKSIRELLVSGIRTEQGQDQTDPRPGQSRYLITRVAGFNVSEFGARYFCVWDIVRDRKQTLYVKITLQDPAHSENPIIQEGVIQPSNKTLNVVWGPIAELKMHRLYQVNVFLYHDPDKKVLVDRLTQKIKSYVDTTNSTITVDQSLITNTGETISDALKTLNMQPSLIDSEVLHHR